MMCHCGTPVWKPVRDVSSDLIRKAVLWYVQKELTSPVPLYFTVISLPGHKIFSQASFFPK